MSSTESDFVAVIGGGPAGLMAAEAARAAGARVRVFERMPSVGRKFLLAGKGGLNLTHAEPFVRFQTRFEGPALLPMLEQFDALALRAWAGVLGITTVVGSSSRVFPSDYKAAPLLRRWLHRLRQSGVEFAMHHQWLRWRSDGALEFQTPAGLQQVRPAAVVFALGGASWPRLGSDGAWVAPFSAQGISVTPLAPANCGFDVAWSTHLRDRHAGAPLKRLRGWTRDGPPLYGECVITARGLEGGLIYALSSPLRREFEQTGSATLFLDLLPGVPLDKLTAALSAPRGTRTWASHLRRKAHLEGAKAALLYETQRIEARQDPQQLAQLIKALPVRLTGTCPLAEAISTAGGVTFEAVDSSLMVIRRPGIFVAGEMLDWDAPTGGYLLTACFATGRLAGQRAAAWAQAQPSHVDG